MVVHKQYWPSFPYAELAAVYDTIMPMSYFTWHHPTGESTHWYIEQNIKIVRREVGSDQVPIHVIGGIAQEASLEQADAFVHALRERGDRRRELLHLHRRAWSRNGRHCNRSRRTRWRRRPCRSRSATSRSATSPASTRPTGRASCTRSVGSRGIGRLSYDAFDAQAGEITIYVNWVARATVDVGPDGDWTGLRQLLIPDEQLVDGQTNTIAFVPSDAAGTWGVRTVSLAKAS